MERGFNWNASVYHDNKIIMIGGRDHNWIYHSVISYDVIENTYQKCSVKDLPKKMSSISAAKVKKEGETIALIFGGV